MELEDVKAKADGHYGEYVRLMKKVECLGDECKLDGDQFNTANLAAHINAATELGKWFASIMIYDELKKATANTRPVAAAPTLLAACEAIVDHIDSGEYLRVDDVEYEDLKQAITKG